MSARTRTPTDEVRTEIYRAGLGAPVEQATPTYVDHPPDAAVRATVPTERSEPFRVISMKDRPDTDRPRDEHPPRQVQLRSMADVSGRRNTPPAGLGHYAPPRDPRQARARRLRANIMWAFVAIGLACAITLAIWLLAGR